MTEPACWLCWALGARGSLRLLRALFCVKILVYSTLLLKAKRLIFFDFLDNRKFNASFFSPTKLKVNLLGPDGHTRMFLGQFDHPGFKSEVQNFQ